MKAAKGTEAARQYVELPLAPAKIIDAQTTAFAQGEATVPSMTNVVVDSDGIVTARGGIEDPYEIAEDASQPYGYPAIYGSVGGSDVLAFVTYDQGSGWRLLVTDMADPTTVSYALEEPSGDDFTFSARPFAVRGGPYFYFLDPSNPNPAPGGYPAYLMYRLFKVGTEYLLQLAGTGVPTITGVTDPGAGSGSCPGGTWGYALEYAKQSSGVDVIASTPQRWKDSTTGVIQTITLPASAIARITFTNPLLDESWDVFRIYRTVDIDSEDSPGSVDDFYLVQEFTRAQWAARSVGSQVYFEDYFLVSDEDLLNGGSLVTDPELDHLRMSSAITAIRWCNGRFWFGSWYADKVIMWSCGTGKYQESYNAADLYDTGVNPIAITAMAVLGNDLLVCRPNETGCYYNPSPESALYTVIDSGVGVSKPDGLVEVKRRVVLGFTNVGFRANSLYEWDTKYQDSIVIGDAFAESVSAEAPMWAAIMGNVVFVSNGTQTLAIHEDDKSMAYWSVATWGVPIPLFALGRDMWFSVGGVFARYRSGTTQTKDFSATDDLDISWSLNLPVVKVPEGGMGLVEQKQLECMVENVEQAISAAVSGSVGTSVTMASLPLASSGTTGTYGRVTFYAREAPATRPMGERLIYVLSGAGPFSMSRIVWKGFIAMGNSRGVRLFDESADDLNLNSFMQGLAGRLSRPDFTADAVTGYVVEEV